MSSKTERDIKLHLAATESVYGATDAVGIPAKPDHLREIPRLIGVVP